MSLTKTSYSMIRGAPLNVLDFGATGNGTTDDTAAIQAAITYIYSLANPSGVSAIPALYFPAGIYLLSSTITMGNNSASWFVSPYFYGDGVGTIIKVTAINVNPFLWQGPNIGVAGAGNQCAGPTIKDMQFQGPGKSTAGASSVGLNFNTVQGTTLINTSVSGFHIGELYQNHDIITRIDASVRDNYSGIITGASGAFLSGGGQLNSFNIYNGFVTGNTLYGIFYVGGQAPNFYGINFVANGTSLSLSNNNVPLSGSIVTAGPVVSGCYFENDTSSTIVLGGGAGTVRDLIFQGGAIIANTANPVILVQNYTDTTGRGYINSSINSTGGGAIINQSSSTGKIAYQTLDNVAIGSVIPSTGVFTTVRSGLFIKGAGIGASVNLLSIGTYASVLSMSMTIIATATGVSTARKYQIAIMGGGTVTGSDVSFVTEVYSGGGCAFSLVETQDSPTAGTNKLSISNTSGVAATYRVTYTVEDLTGTLTLL